MPDSARCLRDVKSDDEWFSEVPKRGWLGMSKIGKKIPCRTCLTEAILVIWKQIVRFEMFDEMGVKQSFENLSNSRTHFRTRMTYSSQKSCVKIQFGLVEIGGMLSFGESMRGGGGEAPYYRGYMWPAMPIFELGRAILVKSHMWKFGSDWLRLSRVIVVT